MAKTPSKKANKNIPVVYAYGVVNDAMASQVAYSLDYYSSVAESIDLHLNSSGGSIYHGAAVYNCIKNCKVPVDVYIDGVAASMGGYLALAGRKVYMSKYARIMLHEGAMLEGGTAEELRDMANEVDACNNNLVAMTCARTGMTEADVKSRFFNGKDNWLSAKEAVAMKLVDGIYDIDEVNVPEAANHIEVYARLTEAYQNGVFKIENYMPEFKMPKEALAAVGLSEGASEAEYNKAVMALAKSNSDLTLQLQKQKDDAAQKEVESLLAQAVEKKQITVELSGVLAVQHAGKPESVKAVLAAMPGYVSVNDQLNTQSVQRGGGASYKPEAVALMKEGWDALHKTGRLKSLIAADPAAFRELYKVKYGFYPNESPLPQGVTGNLAADMSKSQGTKGSVSVKW